MAVQYKLRNQNQTFDNGLDVKKRYRAFRTQGMSQKFLETNPVIDFTSVFFLVIATVFLA
jgi:hypothetical protein